jgi:alpha-beta hydrolase superfamily lysophospholipase
LVFLIAACSGGSKGDSSRSATSSSRPAAIRAPRGDLYQPPADMRPAQPGTLIWARLFAQRVGDPKLFPEATIWQMLYHSRDRAGRDIAVSGYAVVPEGKQPAGGRPVYAWAHPLVGLGDRCAPSKAIPDHLPPYGRPQVRRGAVLVATDYEGLGTPGNYPYLSGEAEGRGVLDSIRAAEQLPNAGSAGDVVIAGESEGGNAALWAAQIAHEYAPELPVRGVLALAPVADLPTFITAISTTRGRLGVALIAAQGLHAGSPDFAPNTYLLPAAVNDLARVNTECATATIARYRARTPTSVIRRYQNQVRAFHDLLVSNSPGATNPRVPILILQGGRDAEIPARVSADLRTDYCAVDATVTRIVYPGANHRGVIKAAQTDALKWITDRFRNQRATSGCKR